MQNQLQRAINLAKKTGDKLIIFDSAKAEEACIILPLKDYENLILNNSEVRGLTEDELLDKVNRDIAIWKSEQNNEQVFEKINKIPSAMYSANQIEIEQKENDLNSLSDELDRRRNKNWSIPSERKKYAEEILEEDRQYLEEVLEN